ncbi:MAG: SAM-dependent methyltransferase [Gemmatimonadetes bacterium 13_1_20CM_4_66_11]|nr:MAG: SAM-dependent methyltransferase [Gemmatimonadetes bacterium 13_1_20CM_4_66_11]
MSPPVRRTRAGSAPQRSAKRRGCCRHCGARLTHTFVDLGMSPLCESYLREDQLDEMEPFYPLHVYVCHRCFLVQLQEYVSPEAIFREYAYFSSYSNSWLDHARTYTAQVIERLRLNGESWVVEIASNDGYLLQWFVARGIPAQGIEPAANVAAVAIRKGVPTLIEFFGRELASELAAGGRLADLLIGNNVLAQVPDLNDFVAGLKILLAPRGVITMEFPHLPRLVEGNQFDTIYHEHFSYFSFLAVERVFAAHQLVLFDVEELDTHGGSLRIYGRHPEDSSKPVTQAVRALRVREEAAGLLSLEYYTPFQRRVQDTKRRLIEFLIQARLAGGSIVGYGAPGKGNTLLNYCGIRTDFLDYTVDRSPYKQGKFLPGTHIPIFPPEEIWETRPTYLFILPWNLKDEIMDQMAGIRDWGGQFIVPIPEVRIY